QPLARRKRRADLHAFRQKLDAALRRAVIADLDASLAPGRVRKIDEDLRAAFGERALAGGPLAHGVDLERAGVELERDRRAGRGGDTDHLDAADCALLEIDFERDSVVLDVE